MAFAMQFMSGNFLFPLSEKLEAVNCNISINERLGKYSTKGSDFHRLRGAIAIAIDAPQDIK